MQQKLLYLQNKSPYELYVKKDFISRVKYPLLDGGNITLSCFQHTV